MKVVRTHTVVKKIEKKPGSHVLREGRMRSLGSIEKLTNDLYGRFEQSLKRFFGKPGTTIQFLKTVPFSSNQNYFSRDCGELLPLFVLLCRLKNKPKIYEMEVNDCKAKPLTHDIRVRLLHF